MYLSYAMLTLSNPRRPDLAAVEVKALADTGSVHLCVPHEVARQLGLETHHEEVVTIADGSKLRVPYVGPVELRFKNRGGFVGALVLGNQVLLGAIPMADMDLVVIPRDCRVDVNPESPNIAHSVVM